jgi:MoaA/NifB/PqqE/SkfB family radical SAM enzyme
MVEQMFNSIRGFHIEPTNICTVKCPGCPRTQFINQWPQHWRNHNLDINTLLKFLDIDLSGKILMLCGNYGDPIYHPDFIDFVSKLKNRGASISIHTNGSYKKADWWSKLTTLLDQQDTITFSIDGLPNNFTEYRIHADWTSIETGIQTCVDNGIKTNWKYIPFSYNQDNIEQAKALSIQLGISEFIVDPSDRFDEHTAYLKPTDTFLGSRFTKQVDWKNDVRTDVVNPKCSRGDQHFISAEGFYSPCCNLADHRFYYKTQFGKQKKHYNIQEHTLSQILSESTVVNFYQKLEQHPVCQFNCPG